MGKIRTVKLGDEEQEKEQSRKAEVRREAKKFKKHKEEEAVTVPGEVASVETDSDEAKEDKKGKKSNKEVKQKTRSKKYQQAAALVDTKKLYPLTEAIALVKKTSISKFDGTVEVHVNLNPLSLGGKEDFRGSVNMPHGTGKKVNVAIVDDEILKKLEAGNIDFDVLIAHPSMMAKIAKYARVLGPKGLMPNPKNGTVTDQPEKRAKELAGGLVNFKTEQNSMNLHLTVGKVSFEETQLTENIIALVKAVGVNKILKATLSASMGPGIKVDTSNL